MISLYVLCVMRQWKRFYPQLSHQLLSTDSQRSERAQRCMFRYTRVVINSQSILVVHKP